jgi:ABC-2 type transport system permease protein
VTALPPPGLSGAVYDRGYRPYVGPRGGRREAALAVWRLSVRRALGLRRSWRQKVFPWSLLAVATVPAVVFVGIAWALRNDTYDLQEFMTTDFLTYREYVGVSMSLLLFVALSAPDLLCPDRANRVLPLMFSRPLTGNDYVAAKLAALTFILFGFGFLPQVVLFVGRMLVSDGALDYFTDNAEVLWQVPAAVFLLALYYAALGLALSSLTDRRIVGGVALLGTTLVTSAIAGIADESGSPASGGTPVAVIDLLALPLNVRDLVFLGRLGADSGLSEVGGGGVLAVVSYLIVLVVSLSVLVYRYREVDL